MAKGIFVVGSERSGTTWITDILCSNDNIAGIKYNNTTLESVYFSHVAGNFGDLNNAHKFIIFVSLFKMSRFFQLSGIDEKIFYMKRPYTYHDFFRILMDKFAKNKKSEFWIEKSPGHALHLFEISKYYDDAKFVAIERNITDQIKSSIKLHENLAKKFSEKLGRQIKRKNKIILLLMEIIKYHTIYKHIYKFKSKYPNKIRIIQYEDLVSSTRKTTSDICSFLNVDFQEKMITSKFQTNSSFTSEDERKSVFSLADICFIKISNFLFKLLPYSIFHLMYIILKSRKIINLPFWFFPSIEELSQKK